MRELTELFWMFLPAGAANISPLRGGRSGAYFGTIRGLRASHEKNSHMNPFRRIFVFFVIAVLFLGGGAIARAHEGGVEEDGGENLVLEWVNFTKEGIVASARNEARTLQREEGEVVFEWLRCEKGACSTVAAPYEWKNEEPWQKGERRVVDSRDVEGLRAWVLSQPFGVSRVRVLLDPGGAIAESSESDNAWEERPISPKTSGKALAARDALLQKIEGETPEVLPGSGLYMFKSIWREMNVFFVFFDKEKRAEKRLARAKERFLEIEALVAEKKYEHVAKTMYRMMEDFEKAKRAAGKQELAERVKGALSLEDVETNAPLQYAWEIHEARKGLLVGISRRLFELREDEYIFEILHDGVRKRSAGPFALLRGLKFLGNVQQYYPGGESEEIQTLERELIEEFELRLAYLPEDIRQETASYITHIANDEESATRFLQRIALLEDTEGKGIEAARRALRDAESEIRGELKEKLEEKTKEEERARTEAAVREKMERKGEEGMIIESPKEKEEEKIPEEALCSEHILPVCGADDVTYENECMAKKKGVKIWKEGVCELALPDLLIFQAELTPKEPKSGDWLGIQAFITNNGGTAQKLFRNRLRIDADINGFFDALPNDVSLNLLRTSSSERIWWEKAWQTVEGVHRLELCADSGRAVEESNEGNNCTILAFPVGPAPTSTLEASTSTSANASTSIP
ncbi:MAG: CARDB domain-containing protein [Patescibacteria group bacterium]